MPSNTDCTIQCSQHGWGDVYHSDAYRRCATVEKCRSYDPDTAYRVEMFTYTLFPDGSRRRYDLHVSKAYSELEAHVVARAWCNCKLNRH